jgi:copper chaperone
MTTTTYLVSGMTCGHCVSAVTEEISSREGVTGVEVDLVAGGTSRVTVTSTTELPAAAVADAVEEAGHHLVGTSQ